MLFMAVAQRPAAGEDGLADADLPDEHLQVHHRLRGGPRPGLPGAETQDGRRPGEHDRLETLPRIACKYVAEQLSILNKC